MREIPLAEQALLEQIAGGDADPRVRRAAVRRVQGPAALGALATGDADAGVREEAIEALLAIALGPEPAAAGAALAAIGETRHLVTLARSAPLAGVRRSALDRIAEPHPLATLARTADDAAVRLEALRRLEAPALLAEVALKCDHKDAALAAVQRIEDAAALEAVVSRGRNRAAARAAAARLEVWRRAAVSSSTPVAAAESAVQEPEPPPAPPEEPEAADQALTPALPAEPIAPAPASAEQEPTRPVEPPAADPAPETAASAPPPAAPAPPIKTEADEAALVRKRAERERHEALQRATALCARLETLGKAPEIALRDADAGLREARTAREDLERLAVGGGAVGRRLRAARAALFARSQELREADEWSRWANATVQEQLCALMESFVGRDDLPQVARDLHKADERWAEARTAPRDQAEALRHRYQAARSQVKARLDAYFATKAEREAEGLRKREEICVKAEALADSTEWIRAGEELKALQVLWKEAGPGPRKTTKVLWKRFRTACDRFFTRRHEDLHRRKQEWAAHLTRKQELCASAEAAAASTDWDPTAAEIRRLQAEWRTIGPVRRSQSEALWQRFHAACDAFFERYKRRDEVEAEAKRAEREALCGELEALVPAGEAVPAPEGLAERVQALLLRARQAPSLPPRVEEEMARRLGEARSRVVAAYPESFRGTELDPELNRTRKEKLCARVEALVASAAETSSAGLSGEALARRLMEALAARTIGGAAEAEAQGLAEVEEVEAAQAAWARIGLLPGEAGAALEERFRSACARFFEARPRSAFRARSGAPGAAPGPGRRSSPPRGRSPGGSPDPRRRRG